jgi:transcriptional regulator with XRE-family HTH domain
MNMELGQKLRHARQEAGLSQRQLCGEKITRNMLSQIENDSARPSMDTLRYLAQRLGRPISYFLEEQVVISPNQPVMEQARAAFARQEYETVLAQLAQYQPPDEVFDWEQQLLVALCSIELAQQAIEKGKIPYAETLLTQAEQVKTPYFTPGLERQRLILLAECTGGAELPSDDQALLLRAGQSLRQGNALRAIQYLDVAEEQTSPRWNFLRGQAHMVLEQFEEALPCLQAAEGRYPKDAIPLLEQCCRELEDYKGAYLYACKLRELGR